MNGLLLTTLNPDERILETNAATASGGTAPRDNDPSSVEVITHLSAKVPRGFVVPNSDRGESYG
jgi:hypothetical protein